MGTDLRDERARQLDGEHRSRRGNLDMTGQAGALHIAVRLARRAAEPVGQQSRSLNRWHSVPEQISGGVDPLGELITTNTAGRPTTRHVTKILLDMSSTVRDAPQPFPTVIAQRHLKTEVANCVGGVQTHARRVVVVGRTASTTVLLRLASARLDRRTYATNFRRGTLGPEGDIFVLAEQGQQWTFYALLLVGAAAGFATVVVITGSSQRGIRPPTNTRGRPPLTQSKSATRRSGRPPS
jgi:hypothetical protein